MDDLLSVVKEVYKVWVVVVDDSLVVKEVYKVRVVVVDDL